MPKFSAYMRGEKGIQGETGQASLLDGIVDGYNNLPDRSNLIEDKNYVYYVKEEDGIHLYAYEGGSGEDWQHLGVVTAGFSTTQFASASTKEWFPGVQPDVTITPHEAQQTTGLKSFDFHFDIPKSQPAGFSTNQLTSVSTLNWNENATVEITPDENSPDWDKSFLFKFGIPHGREAGFSTTQRVSVSTLSWTSDATISVSTTEDSDENPFYNKVFDFAFGIPQGEPAGFGTLSATVEVLEDHLANAELSVSSSGPNLAKDIEFQLKIPQAHPAGIHSVSTITTTTRYDIPASVSATATGNDWEKDFKFEFSIPEGRPAGFADEMEVSVTTLSSTSDATVSITPDETTPDYAKKFNFEFGIPNGVPGGFGNISVSTQQVDALTPAQVSVTTSGPDSAKNIDFLFKIPQGKSSGSAGGYIGTYVSRSFTSTSIDSTSTIYWDNNNILHIKNQNNNTIPIYIINNENQNIFSAFKIDKENEDILYYGDAPFDGNIYLIAESAIPEFIIHNVNTVSSSTPVSIEAQYIDDDLSQVFLNFNIPKGVGISTITKDESYISTTTNRYKVLYENGQYSTFDVTKGDKGDKGDQGSEGIGISEIKKTSTEGLIDTYTITYTNGDTYSYNIKNGEKGESGLGISSITKTNEDELVDTYTITYTDNSTTTFTITNGAPGNIGSPGRGIQNIEYQNTQDLINNYIINYTDGTTSSITTTNGRNALTFSIGDVISLSTNENAYASITTDLQGNVSLNLGIPKGSQGPQGEQGIPGLNGEQGPEGPKGDTGNGISSIEKINEQGLQDIYAITYTDGTFDTFTITNGKNGATKWGDISEKPTSYPTYWDLIQEKPISFTTNWDLIQNKPILSTLINLESNSAVDILQNNSRPGVTGILPIEHGGTGVSETTLIWSTLGGGEIGKKNNLEISDIPSLPYLSSLTNNTITTQIIGNSIGSSYAFGKDYSIIVRENSLSNSCAEPAISMIGLEGDWSFGKGAGDDESLIFSYITHANYSTSTKGGYLIKLPAAYSVTTSGYITRFLYTGQASKTDLGVNKSLPTNTIYLVYEG